MPSLQDPVSQLHLVSPSVAKALFRLGVRTVSDLLYYFPRNWQDLSNIKTIAEIKPNETINLRAKIKELSERRTPWRRMHLTEALLEDKTSNIIAIWFNQPFLRNVLKVGREYYFSGKAQIYAEKTGRNVLELVGPAFELVKEDTIHTAGIIPLYELTEPLTQKQFRYFLKQAFGALKQIQEYLPPLLLKKLSLLKIREALCNIHFPENQEKLAQASKRLSFDELFLSQLALQSYRRKLKILPAPPIVFQKTLIANFVKSLPFKLTSSQRLAVWDILNDLTKSYPMNRLLEGEVGSGKTVVAGIAMLEVASAGYQSVMLAPTEILAWQHYQTLKELFKNTNLKIALLTRSHKEISTPSQSPPSHGGEIPSFSLSRREREEEEGLLAQISTGQVKIIIGTHALLQEKVKFHKIGLLVVDEQHRFGVKQRAELIRRQTQTDMQTDADRISNRERSPHQSTFSQRSSAFKVPHLLSMSATPIPRTLALAFYGDLDISELKELPSGRKKVITRLVEPEKRSQAYEFIRKQIQEGRQMYVVTPLIEESDKLGVRAATLEAEKLRTQIFPEFSIGLLHSRMQGQEKKKIMEEFKAGKLPILVSTTVIEVGMDVPNAAIILIENAERFGLAQLHQLRGRVGRSDIQSYCLLFAETSSEYTKTRLEAVVNCNDGFALAEKDLELRGAGEILGTMQHGFIPFKIAKLSDHSLIKLAKLEAENLLDEDSALAHYPLLKQKVEILAKDAHLE